ncbi:histone-lysine N-methyltransferase ATXR2 isoform X2 [Abrus precatorius]|uniref:Histone-lysine N-methyltransferase ATXR2 isoform X2 n=1 Tax=Abrus precatorius TaxID=3816 RepID=A0A8B8KEC1_ABRPR|nr:histone-lysine N-methyltransferase ATXR2 isoform X2 [Abrus precatorius]
MEPSCPIWSRCATEISALLAPPSPLQLQEYYHNLLSARQCSGIIVKQDDNVGKGLYAAADFKEGELVLKDQMLVGVQHSLNKIDCLVCSFCFRFIGSIEHQIGRRLYLQQLSANESHGSDVGNSGSSKHWHEVDSSDEEESTQQCTSGSSKTKVPLPEGVVESLMNGKLRLPCSEKFSLPPAVPCPGGCGEAYYCSTSCAEADWESSHSLLCTGDSCDPEHREALLKFIKHANETNDIFLLTAKAIAFTILKYRKLKAVSLEEPANYDTPCVSSHCNLSLLLEAWRPISMGHKRRWWDCIALPDDVDSSDEDSFRMQIKELAYESLQLLKSAIFDKESSPVEDYFLYIDDLTYPNKEEAEKVTQPILGALGEDYSICCQGSAFFPLQSCFNHSCCPSAKAFKRDEDKDGQATIIALTSICKGEEITISYVDEDLPFEERQASLADYGFRCRCSKCIAEGP